MTFFARRVLIALLMCSALVLSAAAQEGVTVSGSGVVGQAFTALVSDDSFSYSFNGTQNGLQTFCAGNSDIALASRPLSASEEAICATNGVVFSEVLLGFDGYALIASPDVDFTSCISINQLDALIAPSLVGTDVSWILNDSGYPDLPVTFVYAGALSRPASLLDRSVRGEGFRSDALVLEDGAAVIADVAAGSGKLGLVSLTDIADAEGVAVLDLENSTLGRCVEPTAENALDRQYSGGDRLFVYVNADVLENATVAAALAAVTAPEAADVLTAAGFVPATEALREQAAAVVAEGTTGRVFSNEVSTFQITGDAAGTLSVGSAAAGISYLDAALGTVTQRYPSITVEKSFLGAPAAIREFCNGNRDIIALSGTLSAEDQAACDAAEVSAYEIALGAKAAVLIANAESDYLSCLPLDAIATVFGSSAAPVASWDAYDAGFAADPVYFFVSGKSDSLVDVLFAAAAGASLPVREDVQVNSDAAYRAAAVANTPGAVALVSWNEAQTLLASQAGIQLVGIEAEGGACVVPSAESLVDRTYPLAQHVRLLVSERALERLTVQAALYVMFGDDNYYQIEQSGFSGVAFADLVDIRSDLIAAFAAADAAEAERFAAETAAAAEATPEVTVEPEG